MKTCEVCGKPAVLQIKVPGSTWFAVCMDHLRDFRRDEAIEGQRSVDWPKDK